MGVHGAVCEDGRGGIGRDLHLDVDGVYDVVEAGVGGAVACAPARARTSEQRPQPRPAPRACKQRSQRCKEDDKRERGGREEGGRKEEGGGQYRTWDRQLGSGEGSRGAHPAI
eukprot:500330-Rhodomonas_salina.1